MEISVNATFQKRALTYIGGKKQWLHALMEVTRTRINCNAKLQLSTVFTTVPPSMCGKNSCSYTTKRIKRRAVLASVSVSPSGSVHCISPIAVDVM